MHNLLFHRQELLAFGVLLVLGPRSRSEAEVGAWIACNDRPPAVCSAPTQPSSLITGLSSLDQVLLLE